MKKVGVLGLQRSGTTYLMWLLRHNFDVEIDKKIWKHALPTDDRNWYKQPIGRAAINLLPNPTFLIFKDIDHWLASIEREPKDFYQTRGSMDKDELAVFYQRYLHAWHGHVHFLRYENFLGDIEGSLNKVGEIIGQQPKSYLEPSTVPSSPNWQYEDRERYV